MTAINNIRDCKYNLLQVRTYICAVNKQVDIQLYSKDLTSKVEDQFHLGKNKND